MADGGLISYVFKSDDKFVNAIDIAPNEIITNYQYNRNYLKLRDNDIRLFNQSLITEGTFKKITFWNESTMYSANDLVWFNEYIYDPEQLEWGIKYVIDVRTYLLRSIVNGNRSTPVKTLTNGLANFDDSNWRLVSEISQIWQDSTLSGSEYLSSRIERELYSQHEVQSEGYHVHGKLSAVSELSNLLDLNMQNLNPERKNVFFVTKTDELAATNTIIGGTARYWGERGSNVQRVIEYDITFQLGDAIILRSIDENGNEIISRTLSANSFVPLEDVAAGPYMNRNSDYYFTSKDRKIFSAYPSNSPDVKYDQMIQKNLNQFLNVYTGTITFPELFADLNYMVFSTSSSQTVRTAYPLIWTNKTRRSITAMLILPVTTTVAAGILKNNQFRCHVIGALSKNV